MTVFTEGRHAGEFLLSEAGGHLSRENITIKSGAGKLKAGTVLGKEHAGAMTSAVKSGGANTGTGTLTPDATTPTLSGAIVGVYKLRFVTATVFQITDPNGVLVGTYAIGGSNGNSVTVSSILKFVLLQASTVFVIGDGFDLTVPAGTLKWVASPATGEVGSETADGILYDNVDATSADQAAVAIVRQAEVNGKLLSYASSVDDDTKKAAKATQLAALGIIVR